MKVLFAVLFGLAGCDFDDDGLGSFNESASGTKVFDSDSDGDGLSDGDEVLRYQTDPVSEDSDGDGAADGVEIDYGFDPLNELSAPYAKGWPMTLAARKDGLSGAPEEMIVGQRLQRTVLLGKDREVVDLYDYSLHSQPVLMVVGNSGVIVAEMDLLPGGNSLILSRWIVERVGSGEVMFLAVATLGPWDYPRPPELADIKRCEDTAYGCFADASWDLFRNVGNEEAYTVILLDEEMVVLATSSASNQVPLDAAVAAALGVPPPE